MVDIKTEIRHPKERVGVVVRVKMKKTVIVEVTRLAQHPEYIKVVKHRKRYLAHDENGVSKVGDKVSIVESKPISKLKRWRVAKVIQKD